MRPLEPVSPTQRVTYGIAFFIVFVALWSWATFGGYVSKTFLANPLQMGSIIPSSATFSSPASG